MITALNQLKKVTSDYYDGIPWIDITIIDTLADIDAATACRKFGSLNSIWQILLHITAWRETLLSRLNNDNAQTPENNFIEEIIDVSEKAWQQLQERLQHSQTTLINFLSAQVDAALEDKPAKGNFTSYELLLGIMQHDAYHLGQIVLIKKLIASQ